MKRGQAAMEFLMTYGWAILVVLVAIAALAYFGVLNPSRFLPSSCTIAPGLSCDEFKISAGGTSTVIIRNGMGDNINMSVKLDGTDMTCDGVAGPNKALVLDGNQTTCTITLSGLSEGDRYKADLDVTYVKQGGTLTFTKKGSITTKVEA
ncbi:MAG: hypothetical protein QW404_00855 [Candidatus Nanoarchaeia archaeon]